MRKPRDYDQELMALTAKAQTLKTRKVRQLGDLVIATGADAVGLEMLAGVLIAAMESKDAAANEGWKRRGSAFFRRARTQPEQAANAHQGAAADAGGDQPDPSR